MKIVLAHSNQNYIDNLKVFFSNKGITNIHAFSDGFTALTHIIQNRSHIVIIEENLPGLNAMDIKNALVFKHLKPEIIILKRFNNISPNQILSKIKTQISMDMDKFSL